MNNENSNLEPVQDNVEVLSVSDTTPISDASTFQTVDPTANFQTIDPTADFQTVEPTVVESPIPTTPNISTSVAGGAATVDAVSSNLSTSDNSGVVVNNTAEVSSAPVQAPRATPVDMSTFDATNTRYNPVTGEEMDIKADNGSFQINAVNNEENLKKVEVEYQPSGKSHPGFAVFLFICLIIFVIFLPDIATMISMRGQENETPQEIMTGTLTCKLENTTTYLTHTITREFKYTDKKLQSAKFTTVIRGNASYDEEILDSYNEQCSTIHNNVESLQGITVSCDYKEGKLTEIESFDYSIYDFNNVNAAYTEAGGSVLEFQFEQDIDKVLTTMSQSGFECEKK